jgi:cysteine synthase A
MIDLTVVPDKLERVIRRARERDIIIPTFTQMKDPSRIPAEIVNQTKDAGLWDITPRNLFRITWKNEPIAQGGGYGGVNYLEIPHSITGVEARVFALVGKWFPTGSHKVGATFGCLVPRLVTGQFDPTRDKAVWPSTGNYCRGGAYDATLLGGESIASLPEEMSRERFDWLSTVAGEVIATPGCESNVKEIFDKTWELRRNRDDVVVFNQFDEFGNYLFHYDVTGSAMQEVLEHELRPRDVYSGVVLTTGSSGTLACGDYLKQRFPASKVVAGEALQCPTLTENGFGGHRIEGIGDKHVPWIHNVRNTDVIIAIDDELVVNLARLFNEPKGRRYLAEQGVPEAFISKIDLLGFSSIANLAMAIKFAKYFELGSEAVILTVLTDSMELYQSRLREMQEQNGEYTEAQAARDFAVHLQHLGVDYVTELRYIDKRRVHNLKYYTWVEQQGKTYDEIMDQWNSPEYWTDIQGQTEDIDRLIEDFNQKSGLIGQM